MKEGEALFDETKLSIKPEQMTREESADQDWTLLWLETLPEAQLPSVAKRVYRHIHFRCNLTGHAWMSHREVAKSLGFSVDRKGRSRTVERALQDLEDFGLIERARRFGTTNKYRLLVHEAMPYPVAKESLERLDRQNRRKTVARSDRTEMDVYPGQKVTYTPDNSVRMPRTEMDVYPGQNRPTKVIGKGRAEGKSEKQTEGQKRSDAQTQTALSLSAPALPNGGSLPPAATPIRPIRPTKQPISRSRPGDHPDLGRVERITGILPEETRLHVNRILDHPPANLPNKTFRSVGWALALLDHENKPHKFLRAELKDIIEAKSLEEWGTKRKVHEWSPQFQDWLTNPPNDDDPLVYINQVYDEIREKVQQDQDDHDQWVARARERRRQREAGVGEGNGATDSG